jgi:hypothetical protein
MPTHTSGGKLGISISFLDRLLFLSSVGPGRLTFGKEVSNCHEVYG